MLQLRDKTPRSAFIFAGTTLLILGVLAMVLSSCGSAAKATTLTASQPERHVQAKLDIVINQPGLQKDWPAFSPNNLVLPSNSLVTISVHDYDLGDTAMPQNTPFATVQGTIGGLAYLNGRPYSSLAPDKIAHTFTIQQLNINVPLPGDGKEADTITFTFHTGKAGTYTFRCFDPCGTGSSGWNGPMIMKGYMSGTLTIQ